MKKFYSLLFSITFLLGSLNAQKARQNISLNDKPPSAKSAKALKAKNISKRFGVTQNEIQCAWLDPIAEFRLYFEYGTYGNYFGSNEYNEKEAANFFDFSNTNIIRLDSVALLTYTDVSDFDLPCYVKVYDGTNGTPGAQIGQISTITYGDLADAEFNEEFFFAKFPTPISLPASKKIFISVDYSNLSWDDGDDFGLYSTDSLRTVNIAYILDSDGWYASSVYNYPTAVSIYPYVCADVTTPVALGQLAASNNTFGNTISWSSISETANKGFEVQRSTDGVNFTTIAFVASKALNGNSSATIQYSYIDENPAIGENYYRVKQVDLNANSSFTNIAKIIKGLANTDGLTLYPNPAKDKLNIALNSLNGKKSTITIFNNNGKSVRQISLLGTGSLLNTSVSLDGLANGLYFIKVETEGKIESSRFVKN